MVPMQPGMAMAMGPGGMPMGPGMQGMVPVMVSHAVLCHVCTLDSLWFLDVESCGAAASKEPRLWVA